MTAVIPLILLLAALLLFIGLISVIVILLVARIGKRNKTKGAESSQPSADEEANAWEEAGKRVE